MSEPDLLNHDDRIQNKADMFDESDRGHSVNRVNLRLALDGEKGVSP